MKFNLQQKLLLPTIIVLFLFVAVCAYFLSDILIEKNQSQTIELLYEGNNLLIKNIHNLINNYKLSIRSLSNAPILHALANHLSNAKNNDEIPKHILYRRIYEILEDFPKKYIDYSQLGLADANGNVIASSQPQNIEKENLKERNFFKLAMHGQENVSEPTINPTTGDKVIYIATPVFNSRQEPICVLYGTISCATLTANTIQGAAKSNYGYAYIVDGKSGLILAHNISQNIQRIDMFKYQPWMEDLKPDENGIKTDYIDNHGNRLLAIYHKEAESGWIAVSCVAFKIIEAQASFIRNIIILMMFGTIFLVACVIVAIIKSVTNDIYKTNLYAQEIATGNFDTTLDVHRDDELGELGSALHKMVNSLKKMMTLNIEQAEDKKRNLARLRDTMLISLADIVEGRDKNTWQHIQKTVSYVRIILEELKNEKVYSDTINDDYIDKMISCTPLHDIGKINIPEHILNKSGKLTDDEFSIIKKHTLFGGEIINHIRNIVPDSDYLVIAKDIAIYHHEKWDGSGYPYGLSGNSIPLSARIMAVADVFDALASERPYKRPFSVGRAFFIIREQSGTHFDPRIVSAFLASREKIIRSEAQSRTYEIDTQAPQT